MTRRPAQKRAYDDFHDQRVGLYCRVSLDADETGKSVDDQEAIGREWVEHVGGLLDERHVYRDVSRSASRYATKVREAFARMLVDIEAGELDAIWFWELSRSQRQLGVFAQLRDLCRDKGVVWVIRDRVYDPTSSADMMTTAVLSVVAENESEMTSQRVTRGKKSSAHAGRPGGRVPYGYKRIWNKETGLWERDVPNTHDVDGHPVEDSPAYVVREIFDRVAAGESLTAISRDLNERGLKTTSGYDWDKAKVRYIAMSPTYLGKRVYQVRRNGLSFSGDRSRAVLEGVDAGWPQLVDEATFWIVQRILTDPNRRSYRGTKGVGGRGRTTHLLTSLARCAECDGKLIWRQDRRRQYTYACHERSCVGIRADALDRYVERQIVDWLSDPFTAADLAQVTDNSAAATQVRADVARARAELQQLYTDVKGGAVSATVATLEEERLLALIEDAERRAKEAAMPAVLVDMIGPQAQAGWDALDLAGRRLILRTVADIRVRRMGRGVHAPVHHRVEWRWLAGSATDVIEPPPFVPPAERRALVTLADAPLLQQELPALLGMARGGAHHLVSRLVNRGWIDRQPTSNPETGRRTYALSLTEAGRQTLDQ
jgi:site-specific DNA recombinase